MDENEQLKKLERENLRLKAELGTLKTIKKNSFSLRTWLKRVGSRALVGRNLKASVNQLYQELPRNVQRETLASVTSSLIHRLTRIGTFALIVGLVPLLILLTQTWILDNQNEKLDHQNQLINGQNLLLDQQINLEEGNRRSSYIFLMSNIMDKIDEELKNAKNRNRRLSEELIGRIVSLSHAFRPYRYLENDSLIPKPLSPERGQLLYALVNSKLELVTYDHIFERANFSHSDLPQANFSGAYLQGVNLSDANIEEGNFKDAILDGANFQYSNLQRAIFDNTEMMAANFRSADLRNSEWYDVLAQGVNLSFANVGEAFFNGDFSDAELEGILLHNATLNYVVLRNSFFFNSNWLERMANYGLKGSFSIAENYTVIQDYVSDSRKNVIDTVFRLVPRLESPQFQASLCESIVLNMVRSSEAIQQLDRQQRQLGNPLKYVAQTSPYGDDKLVAHDTIYTFLLSTRDTTQFDARTWVKFDPDDGKLWTISPTLGDTLIQTYSDELWTAFLETCR